MTTVYHAADIVFNFKALNDKFSRPHFYSIPEALVACRTMHLSFFSLNDNNVKQYILINLQLDKINACLPETSAIRHVYYLVCDRLKACMAPVVKYLFSPSGQFGQCVSINLLANE